MKKTRLAAMVLGAVAIAFLVGRLSTGGITPVHHTHDSHKRTGKAPQQLYTCSMHPQVIQDHPGDCPICGMTLTPIKNPAVADTAAATPAEKGERKVLYWRAPMDPTYISKTPGKSPMGMDLVPVYEDQVSSGDIRISPAVVQNIGVTTVEVVKRPLAKTIRTYGVTMWDETSLAAMNTKVSGWIEELDASKTGQVVKKGSPLISIYSPKLVATQQEYLAALDAAESLRESHDPDVAAGGATLLESARLRLKLWDISDQQIGELERTRKVRKTMVLYAPISGIITHRAVVVGDHVEAGMNLVRIASLDPIWVMGSIYEEDMTLVKTGMKVAVNFDNLPGETFAGSVDYVYPYLEGKARTAQVRVRLANKNARILPQMYATLKIRVPVAKDAVVVPTNAVIRTSSTDNVVFIRESRGRFRGRAIVLGPEGDDGMVVVKAGLEPGQRVVTSSQFLLDSESQLNAAIQEMLSHKKTGSL